MRGLFVFGATVIQNGRITCPDIAAANSIGRNWLQTHHFNASSARHKKWGRSPIVRKSNQKKNQLNLRDIEVAVSHVIDSTRGIYTLKIELAGNTCTIVLNHINFSRIAECALIPAT